VDGMAAGAAVDCAGATEVAVSVAAANDSSVERRRIGQEGLLADLEARTSAPLSLRDTSPLLLVSSPRPASDGRAEGAEEEGGVRADDEAAQPVETVDAAVISAVVQPVEMVDATAQAVETVDATVVSTVVCTVVSTATVVPMGEEGSDEEGEEEEEFMIPGGGCGGAREGAAGEGSDEEGEEEEEEEEERQLQQRAGGVELTNKSKVGPGAPSNFHLFFFVIDLKPGEEGSKCI